MKATPTHYEILGVTPSATPEEIKKAFRKKASSAHSDREGGSDELMAAVNVAYAVLSDPERRQQYDATGSSKPVTPFDEEARTMLLKILDHAIDEDTDNPLDLARSIVRSNVTKVQADIAEALRKAKSLKKQRPRVRVKGDGLNLVHGLIDQKFALLQEALPAMKAHLAKLERVLEVLDEHEYVGPAPEAAARSTSTASYPSFMFVRETTFGTSPPGARSS